MQAEQALIAKALVMVNKSTSLMRRMFGSFVHTHDPLVACLSQILSNRRQVLISLAMSKSQGKNISGLEAERNAVLEVIFKVVLQKVTKKGVHIGSERSQRACGVEIQVHLDRVNL